MAQSLNAERSKLQSGRDAEGFEHEQVSQVAEAVV